MSRKQRKAWQVEIFVPTECPKCRQKFENHGEDFLPLFAFQRQAHGLHTIYDIIVCTKCENQTARVKIEARHFFEKQDAEKFLKELGHGSICEVVEGGKNAEKEVRIVYPLGSGLLKVHYQGEEDEQK